MELEVELDDELVRNAIECTGRTDFSELCQMALRELIEREQRRAEFMSKSPRR